MAPISQHVSSPFNPLPSQVAPRHHTFPRKHLPFDDPSTRIHIGLKARTESNDNPFSGSSPKVTAATIGGFVGAFVLVLALATGLFIWFRKRSKRRRESYSRITSMPWDRSPLFMVAPQQNQQHDSYRGISTHHSFPGPAMEIGHNVPRLLPPPRPPPPSASRDTVQLRHKSSGLILPPRPELENTQVVEKDSRHLNLQLNGPSTTGVRDTLRPESTSQADYMHYHQQARFTLSPAVNPKLVRKNIDGLYPDSPTLALTPVHARYAQKSPGQKPPGSPTSIYSNSESMPSSDTTSSRDPGSDSSGAKEEKPAIYQTAKQVFINSPTLAHTSAPPREFHKSTRYLYPDIPSAPRTPPVPKQVHLSTAYLYAADITRPPEEKRNKLRKAAPNSPVKSPFSAIAMDTGTPTIPWKDTRRTMHMSTPAVPSQQVRKTTSMQDLRLRAVPAVSVEPTIMASAAVPKTSKEVPVENLNARRLNPLAVRPSTVTFDSTTPLETLSSATYKGPSSSRHDRRDVRPRTVTFESRTTVPPAIVSRAPPKSTSPPRPSPLGIRPRTVTFEPTITHPPTILHVSKAPHKGVNFHHPDPKPPNLRPRTVAFGPTITTVDPPRPKSVGPGPTLIIPSQDNFIQEIPKLDTAVVNRSPTKYQYPTSPRLTRRSTSNLNTTGTLPPRSRPYPYRSSSLNPNSHIINSSDNNLVSRNGNSNLSSNTATCSDHNSTQSPTSPINAATADLSYIQDIRSTKYLSSEFAATHGARRQAQRAMAASPTLIASPTEPTMATPPNTPGTYGTAIVTSTVSYSRSQRRGQHHSIQPPHRLMAPLSRGTNVSPRMGMGVGLGSGWI